MPRTHEPRCASGRFERFKEYHREVKERLAEREARGEEQAAAGTPPAYCQAPRAPPAPPTPPAPPAPPRVQTTGRAAGPPPPPPRPPAAPLPAAHPKPAALRVTAPRQPYTLVNAGPEEEGGGLAALEARAAPS